MPAVLAVAIINYETPDLTAHCAASVRAAPPSEPYELVVVDNGSSAATRDALRDLEGVRLVETGVNGGFATGVNRCVAEASPEADAIVVLNSDTEVQPGALDALAAAVRRDGIGLSAPVILDRNRDVQRSGHRRLPTLASTWAAICVPLAYLLFLLERWVPHPTALSVAEHEAAVEPAHVMGAVMAFDRAAWDAVGPFDERFFLYLEETEWQGRLTAAGGRIAIVPAARVLHLHRGGDEAIGVPTLHYLDSARLYFRAHGHRDRTIRAVLASSLLVSYLALLAYRPLTRWVPAHRGIVAASLPAARKAVRHLMRGDWVRRPDGRGHARQR
jgi:N-acetylglucosaminyl-diphospho-decaprenol L-rhamnosyltransferase